MNVDDLKKGREGVRLDDPQGCFTTLLRKCQEWPEGVTDAAIESITMAL